MENKTCFDLMRSTPNKKYYEEFLIFFILLLFVAIPSCKKETSCEACNENNKPPISIAGPDQIITLPTDSVSLYGKNSSDPDGTISEWLWKKISGPASFTILHPGDSNSLVKNLIAGTYQFELTVTDNGGLTAKDTMQVIVDVIVTSNHPPVANAGPDQTIILPTNTINLDGSGSTDPDNNITSYVWTKISGPSSFNITNANAVHTPVVNLVQGVYLLELKVTDAGGLFSKDTVQIAVNPAVVTLACDNSNRTQVIAQLIPIGTLSQARIEMAVASAGNKILFAGGMKVENNGWVESSRVDIYDVNAKTWSTAELSIGRYNGIGAASSGNKIFFGGGEIGDGTWPVDTVDIYDVAANTWAVSHLSSAGNQIEATAVGNKVFFAGGNHGFAGTAGVIRNKQIDIYDLTTGLWSAIQLNNILSEGNPVVVVNNKIYFSGFLIQRNPDNSGFYLTTNEIEVYEIATASWSVDHLQTAKTPSAGIAVGNKIFWVDNVSGNTNSTCLVEIKDITTGTSSIQYLHKPAERPVVIAKDGKVIFFRTWGDDRDKFDIYDTITGIWSIGVLPQPIPKWPSIISVNNVIYVAGGGSTGIGATNQVWKLDF